MEHSLNDKYIHDDDIVINKLGYNSKPAEFPDNKLLSAEFVNNEFNNFVNNEKLITTLNDYRRKDDLTLNMIVNLPIEHKTPEGAYDFSGETAFVEFHEGALLEGYALFYDGEIDEVVYRDFSITFHTDRVDGDLHMCDTIISTEVEGFCWNERTNVFLACGAVEMAVHLNSAKFYVEDTLALKTDNAL